jgi:competence protein ComEA
MMKILTTILSATLCLLLSTGVFAGPVDINSADAATLAETIDGVGERKAMAIVEYREIHGPFLTVDELAGVKGIGEKTVERNREKLTVVKPAR